MAALTIAVALCAGNVRCGALVRKAAPVRGTAITTTRQALKTVAMAERRRSRKNGKRTIRLFAGASMKLCLCRGDKCLVPLQTASTSRNKATFGIRLGSSHMAEEYFNATIELFEMLPRRRNQSGQTYFSENIRNARYCQLHFGHPFWRQDSWRCSYGILQCIISANGWEEKCQAYPIIFLALPTRTGY